MGQIYSKQSPDLTRMQSTTHDLKQVTMAKKSIETLNIKINVILHSKYCYLHSQAVFDSTLHVWSPGILSESIAHAYLHTY